MGAAGDRPDEERGGERPSHGAPAIANRAQMRNRVAARLFGGATPSSSGAGMHDTEVANGSPVRADEPEIEAIVGRFRVLDRIGRGGMGVVYSAYDPELDRKVAIKLLRADVRAGLSAKDAQTRLLREAQAMARLNHPNVIVVHEVGTVGDSVFVAMEFVDGGTLRAFLQTKPAWRDVLDRFLRAGAGLAAAHAAGLVHRDFKPDNVLLGRDGRVRVVDFGLARSVLDPHRDPERAPITSERPDNDSLNTPLTRTGAVMGTPAYMSPEQHLGHPADARSDQFSFCVALYEGLYGERPFAGADLITLSTNVVRGTLRPPPADVRVPGFIGAALRRGLAPDPKERFASMDALLAELGRQPRRVARRLAIGIGVAVVASGVTYAAIGRDSMAQACRDIAERSSVVWNDDARARVRDVLVASGEPYAPRVVDTTIDLIDRYIEQWNATAEEACASARMAADDPSHDGGPRQRCLDARLAEVEQLVQALTSGASGMTQQAVPAAAELSDLGACKDKRRLVVWTAPNDPAATRRIVEARASLAKAKARGATGAYEEAIAIATEVLEGSEELPSVQANALFVRGQYRERAGQLEESEEDLRSAVERADAVGDYGTKAQALTRLVFVISRDSERYDEAMNLAGEARGVLATLDAVPLLQADLDGVMGAAARNASHFEDALEYHRRALQARERLLGESHPDTASSLANIGSTLSTAKRADEAEPYLRRALASLQAVLGEEHPWVGTALGNLANCLGRQKRLAEALPLQEKSHAILARALGDDHDSVIRTTFNLGKLYGQVGRYDEAEQLLQAGLQRTIDKHGTQAANVPDWYTTLGENAEASGELAKARAYHEHGLEVRIQQGQASFRLAKYHFAIARTLVVDDPERARMLIDQARENAKIWAERDGENKRGREVLDEIEAWLSANEP